MPSTSPNGRFRDVDVQGADHRRVWRPTRPRRRATRRGAVHSYSWVWLQSIDTASPGMPYPAGGAWRPRCRSAAPRWPVLRSGDAGGHEVGEVADRPGAGAANTAVAGGCVDRVHRQVRELVHTRRSTGGAAAVQRPIEAPAPLRSSVGATTSTSCPSSTKAARERGCRASRRRRRSSPGIRRSTVAAAADPPSNRPPGERQVKLRRRRRRLQPGGGRCRPPERTSPSASSSAQIDPLDAVGLEVDAELG
jgi:hypothetical protein